MTIASAILAASLSALSPVTPEPVVALGELGELPVGVDPSGLDVNAAGTLAMVANTDDGTVSVLELGASISVTGTVTVGGKPADVAFSPDGSEVWVGTWDGDTIEIIEVATLTVVDTITGLDGAWSTTFSPDGTTAWVVNYTAGSVAVIDVATRAIDRTISGFASPQQSLLSPDGLSLYVVNTNGVLSRVTLADDSVETVNVGAFPLFLEATPGWDELWVGNNAGLDISIVDPVTFTVTDTITLSDGPVGMEVTPDGKHMLVAHNDGVDMIDIATRTVVTTFVNPNSETYDIVRIPGAHRFLVSVVNYGEVRVLGFEQERLAGANRFETAVEVSQKAFPAGATAVFVANGLNFPDALAAGPAAGFLDGSLLLTSPTTLPTVVRDEILRLEPETIYVVGGTSVVSTAVQAALDAITLPGPTQPTVVRLSGANRYLTGAAIVDTVWDSVTVPEVFIATGRNYPDALSAGAVAAGEGIPVILVDGARTSVPASTIALITQLSPGQITIAGGTSVVSAGIMSQLTSQFGSADVRRLAGSNRYETSTAISADAYPFNAGVIYATGTGFPDALAGATLAGRAQMPLYLVPPTCVTSGGIDAVYQGQASNLYLLGGTSSLSAAVEALTPCS